MSKTYYGYWALSAGSNFSVSPLTDTDPKRLEKRLRKALSTHYRYVKGNAIYAVYAVEPSSPDDKPIKEGRL